MATASSVDVLARFLAEELGDFLLHQRHAGLATDQDHVIDLRHIDAGILQRDAARLDGALDQILDQRLQLGAEIFTFRCFGPTRQP